MPMTIRPQLQDYNDDNEELGFGHWEKEKEPKDQLKSSVKIISSNV